MNSPQDPLQNPNLTPDPNAQGKTISRDKPFHKETPTEKLLRQQLKAGKRKTPTLSGAAKETSGIKLGETTRQFEESQAEIAAKGAKFPYINLFGFPVELDALKLVEEKEALANQVAPFIASNDQVRLATTNPHNPGIKKIEKRLTNKGYKVKTYFVSQSSFKHIVDFYKNLIKEKPAVKLEISLTEEELKRFQESVAGIKDIQTKATQANITELLDLLMAAALQLQASDIHLEPADKFLRVRLRIDGMLHDVAKLSLDLHQQLVSRIKLLAKLKLNITTIAQDGRFSVKTKERTIDIRVSVLPSQYGESIVLRLLGIGAVLLRVKDLGLRDTASEIISEELRKPNGMILTTGPTGSGKTTTLYSFVNELNSTSVKIITLEDPIEYRLPGIQQTQVDDSQGYTFARGLRSILRQDPDVLLIGEIRDLETAETAVSASLTGHVVFSTLHTNDAAGALPRLIDMGVRPFVLAPAINAVIAQRLVRRVCQECSKEYKPDDRDLDFIKNTLGEKLFAKTPKNFTLVRPTGCKVCNFLGYRGRIGVFEVFRIDDVMERLILSAAGTAEIRQAAVDQGMVLMKQDGIFKAISHITTLEEVERVV